MDLNFVFAEWDSSDKRHENLRMKFTRRAVRRDVDVSIRNFLGRDRSNRALPENVRHRISGESKVVRPLRADAGAAKPPKL